MACRDHKPRVRWGLFHDIQLAEEVPASYGDAGGVGAGGASAVGAGGASAQAEAFLETSEWESERGGG